MSSDEDLLSDVKTTRNPVNIEKLLSGEGLWQQLMEPFTKIQPSERASADASPPAERKSSSITPHTERTQTPPSDILQSSSDAPSVRRGSQKSETSSQQYQAPQSPSALSRTSSTSSKATLEQKRSPTSATPRMVSESQILVSIDPSSEIPQEVQPSSRTSSISSKASSHLEKSPLTVIEHQPSSRTSSISSKAPSDIHEPITLPVTPDVQPSFPSEDQPSSRTSSISSQASLAQQKSLFFTTTPEILQPPSPTPDPEDAQTLSHPPQASTLVEDEPEKNSPSTTDDYQIIASTG